MRRCHRLPQPVVPLFPVSSVTGRGLAALHAFLNRLQGASTPVSGLAQQRVAPGMQHQQVRQWGHPRLNDRVLLPVLACRVIRQVMQTSWLSSEQSQARSTSR